MSFGKKSLPSSAKPEPKQSREESKMDYDGFGKSADTDNSNKGKPENLSNSDDTSFLDCTKGKSENLDKERGPYSQMEAARVIRLKTILDVFSL